MNPNLHGAEADNSSATSSKNLWGQKSQTATDREAALAGPDKSALRTVGQVAGALCLAVMVAINPAYADTKPTSLTCDQLKDDVSRIIEKDSRGIQKVIEVKFADGFEKDGILNCYADVLTNRGIILGSYWAFNQKDGSLVRKWEPYWPQAHQ